MPRSRLTAILYLVLVFASGILVGIASTHLYAVKASETPPAPVVAPLAEFTTRYLAEMREKVGVTDEQAEAVRNVLAATKKKYDDLRREGRPARDRIQQEQVDSIRTILTDAQKPAYEAWRAERQRQNRAKSAATSASGPTR